MCKWGRTVALLKMVAPGPGFRGDTQERGLVVSSFVMRLFRSRAATDLNENYVHMQLEAKKKETDKVFSFMLLTKYDNVLFFFVTCSKSLRNN